MDEHLKSRTTTKRYLGNCDSSHREVHDLKREKPQCQIDEIVKAGNAVVFVPDTLDRAHNLDYDNCAYCLGGSKR